MLTIESLIPVIGLCVACFRAFFKHALVYCIVDICQNSAEQGFSGKAPEGGDTLASLGQALRWHR